MSLKLSWLADAASAAVDGDPLMSVCPPGAAICMRASTLSYGYTAVSHDAVVDVIGQWHAEFATACGSGAAPAR